MSAVGSIWSMFLALCEVREIRDETQRRLDPARYLRDRVNRLVAGDRLRDTWDGF